MLYNFNILAGMDVSYVVDCGYTELPGCVTLRTIALSTPYTTRQSSVSTVNHIVYIHPW